MSNTQPNLSYPLINEPAQTSPAAPTTALVPLQHLVGTWTNQNIHGTDQGGTESPYSYNLMPLPQVDPSSPDGYILKNFSYYEEITFSAIHGNAPNRGGSGTQVANTLFYEQRVYFAEGPNKDALVHAENGSWLYLSDRVQVLGPYGDGDGNSVGTTPLQNTTPPTQTYNIVKQISVPHGNSILTAGTFQDVTSGSPTIGDASPVLPVGVNTDQYGEKSVGNPNPAFTQNPNQPLINAIAVTKPTSYIRFDVDSNNGGHPVTNIGFEQQHAKVTRYYATVWLEAFVGSSDFTQLQYTQTMLMAIPIAGEEISFPHITTNTLTKVT
jgi:hypothetical protein